MNTPTIGSETVAAPIRRMNPGYGDSPVSIVKSDCG